MIICGCRYPDAINCIAALQATKTIQGYSFGQGRISVLPIDRHPATIGAIKETAALFGGHPIDKI